MSWSRVTAARATLATAALGVLVLAGCSSSIGGTAGAVGGPTAADDGIAPNTSLRFPSDASSLGEMTWDQLGTSQPGVSYPAGPTTPTVTVTETSALPTEPASPVAPASPAGPTSPVGAQPLPTDQAGQVFGLITAVDPAARTLTLDVVQWFTGAAAAGACAEDGVTGTDNNRCTGWYLRNTNPALRTVSVGADASITLISPSADVGDDLPALQQQVEAMYGGGLYELQVTDGWVTAVKGIYLP